MLLAVFATRSIHHPQLQIMLSGRRTMGKLITTPVMLFRYAFALYRRQLCRNSRIMW
jgi:hypothetical protein